MNDTQAHNALQKYFGYDSFRPNQLEIIEAVYRQQDALVLMPTGGGKSICYQIPALTIPGTALVVSPLISLMKDQVEALRTAGVRAAFLNSSLPTAEQRQVEDDYGSGELKLLYVSPEKLLSGGFFSVLRRRKINLFAIDEAHCISAWGHDFRPEYTRLKTLKEQFPDVPIIALTATADRLTRIDISEQLGLHEPARFVASFDRPNLSLEVRPGRQRIEQILQFLGERGPEQSGIVYCLSRKSTEELAEKLRNRGYTAEAYHAGLSPAERDRVQEAFLKDETPIVCATIAFGMGIDKSNVRWVIHYNLPKNLENYYQEIGRSGRDGAPADTLLFYSFNDVQLLRSILTDNNSANEDLQLAKLERMQQYAESLACRRRILLSYFGEDQSEDCGNCDICRNPPERFDGTIIAQMALSAVYRLREATGLSTTIDVLRGSGRKEIIAKGYDKIKTYGAGRKYTPIDWQHYLSQLINLGYLYIAYEQKGALRLTPASRRVLFEGEPVELVRMATLKERQEASKKKPTVPVGERPRVRDALFEQLRQLRKSLARERGLPPYVIFSDATLEEMAARRPLDDSAMARISGVGEKKLVEYAPAFLDIIRTFTNMDGSASDTSHTRQQTLERYRAGESIESIAAARDLKPTTVQNHLVQLYAEGADLDISPLVSESEIERVSSALRYLEAPYRKKSIYEYLDGTVAYPQIDLALAHLKRLGRLETT